MKNIYQKIYKKTKYRLLFYSSIISFIIVFLLLGLTYFTSVPKLETKLLEDKENFLANVVNSVKDWVLLRIEEYKNNQISINELDNYLLVNINKADASKWYLLANEKGIIIAHSNPNRVWKNLTTLIDGNWFEFWKSILETANSKWNWFLYYEWVNPLETDKNVLKVIYISKYWENNRIFASTISMININEEINKISSEILNIHIRNTIIIAFLLLIVIISWASVEKDKLLYQRKIANLSSHLPIWVFRLTIDWFIDPLMWNNTTLQLFWINKEDILTKNILITKFFNNQKDKDIFLKKLKNWNNIDSMEIKIKNSKWKYIWINIEWNIIKEWENTYFDWLIEDITDRHQIHEILEEAYKNLQKSDGRKNEIIWIASHELRTPLTIIKWFTSILQSEKVWKLNLVQNTYLSKITDNTDKLLFMITEMLDLSKLEAWEISFEEEIFDICVFLKQIHEEFLAKAEIEKKYINLSIPDEEIIVKYDIIQLKRVLINLIWNAFKFIEEEKWQIDNIAKKEKNNVIISIKDNWKWISKKHLKTIFEKFKQLWNETNPNNKWTWLWLSIVKNIIEKMWSKIKVKSKIWEWSEFFFTLKINK